MCISVGAQTSAELHGQILISKEGTPDMGKGNRNRINHMAEPRKPEVKKKQQKFRRQMSEQTKNTIAYCVAALLLVAIVIGSLASYGTFKRSNVLVKSSTGEFDLNQQMATYMVWDALYYTGYYQWSYYSDSIKSSTGITSQSQYCLYYAMSGVQDTLLSSIQNYSATLKEYVAVCDVAEKFGISLTKEEIETAKSEIEAQIQYMAAVNSLSTDGFINYYIGCGVKMKDIKNVAVMQSLYAKVVEQKESEVTAAVTDAILDQYRDDNPESFYSTDYYLFQTDDKDNAKKALLLAATTVGEFLNVYLDEVFNDATSGYTKIFNKYVTGEGGKSIYAQATEVLTAVEKKTTVEELTAALTAQSMETNTYSKSDETLNQTVKDWMFNGTSKQFSAAQFDTADKVYVVVLTSDVANDQVTAAIKTFDLSKGESYGEGEKLDPEFKNNIYKTLQVKYEIIEKADDMKLYDETEDEKIKNILNDLETAIDKAMPAVKTQYYIKLKLQYFGHLMQRVDSLENTLMLGGIGGRKKKRG